MDRHYFKYFLPLAIISLGLSYRLYQLTHVPFDFDQVQIAQAADRILSGDFTLIGPRTGPASMFTGPLIYYLTAGFGLVLPVHYALVTTTGFISLVTGLGLFLLSRKYLSHKYALVITSLWAFSPLLINLDRIPWNPNLSVLAAALVFFPSLKIPQGLKINDLLVVSLGVFLGYQAHFSGFLLLPLFGLAYLIYAPKRKLISLILPSLALVATLTPTILFDFRHNWLNSRGLLSLLSNNDQVSNSNLFPMIWEKLHIAISVLGATLLNQNSSSLILITGMGVFVSWLYIQYQQTKYSRLFTGLGWLVIVSLSFALYRESTPEYYFLILMPFFLFLIADVLIKNLKNKQIIWILVVLGLHAAFLTYNNYHLNSGLNLKTQLATVSALEQISQETPISRVEYDMEFTKDLGLKYFLDKKALTLDDSGSPAWIIHPATLDRNYTVAVSADTVIWVEP